MLREELEVMFCCSQDLRKAHQLKEAFKKVLKRSKFRRSKTCIKKVDRE
nr:hypothetical protein [Caldicellulosiruptor morganii]